MLWEESEAAGYSKLPSDYSNQINVEIVMWEIAYLTQNPTTVLFRAHIGVANPLDGGKNVCNVYLPGGALKKKGPLRQSFGRMLVIGGC